MKKNSTSNKCTSKSFEVISKLKKAIISITLMLTVFNADSQSRTFNISVENATVEVIIDKLRAQSEINFIYNHEEVSKCDPITLSMSNASLEEVLSKALEGTALTYKKINNTIVITPIKPESLLDGKSTRTLKQTVRGSVTDVDSRSPLIGVTVVVSGSSPLIGAITDVDGNYRLENIPIGRITLTLSYLGYEKITIPNIVVNSGKEAVLNLKMKESVIKMDEIIITVDQNKGVALNDMAMVSARSISAEETSRYAGGFSDPSRILTAYAGVTNSQNAENDIIVRGNSPKYIQWRLEGLEISNPTHFGDQNAIKGGISAVNNNLLATSDFYSGAFSPEYGDVLSGVYDINLRTGNNEKFESAIGFGLLGTDLTFEGPLKKGYGGSYLVNYRYSTIGLISDLGLVNIEGQLSFQDATFKIVLPTSRIGTFSFFGLAGLSRFAQKDIEADGQAIPGSSIVLADVSKDFDKADHLLNVGMNHVLTIDKSSFIKTSLSYSNIGIDEDVFLNRSLDRPQDYKNRLLNSTYRGAITYNNKLSVKNKIQVGTKYSLFNYNHEQRQLERNETSLLTLIDFNENVGTLRNFISWQFRMNKSITIVSGIHNMNVLFNNKSTVEPRVAISGKLNNTSSVHAGYGKHSKMESTHNYFAKVEQEDGSITEPNRDLGLLKADHFVIGYENYFTANLSAKVEVYYQHLYDLPVANNDTSYYSTINEGTDFRYVDLVNEGTGKNYGVELTIEKHLNDNYYFLINGSIYSSKYKSLENVERNTQYNGNYLLNILFGKEFENLGRKQNQTLALNGKAFFGGGRKIIPLLRDAQGNVDVDPANNRFFDYDKAYDNKIDDIFQLNISASYKWNKPKATHELFLDLVNVTNHDGRIFEFYNENEPNSIDHVRQFSFFPNLIYRVYF